MSKEGNLTGIFTEGYGKIAKSIMRDKDLTIEAKAIYAYLVSFSGAGLSSFPSTKLMLAELGISNKRYLTHRKLLEDKGYIVIKRERTDNGFSKNRYYIITDISVSSQNVQLQNVHEQNVHEQNDYTINNSSINNSSINNSISNKDIVGKTRFTPPSLEEVTEYCIERNNNVDPQTFIDFYSSKGWYVGKSKMKDWKASVRTWEKRNNGKSKVKQNLDTGGTYS